MHLEDGEDLRYIGRDMADQIEGFMPDAPDSWASQMSSLESTAEDGMFRIVVTQNDGLAYAAGEEQPSDSQLVQAADSIDETDAFISVGNRSVYRIDNTFSGGSWSLYLFGTRQDHLDSGLKVILALAAIRLIFIVFLTILMTNRFLTRFVVRKIEEPLDLLSEGARRLGDGDLDYRIAYTEKDEFAPVCGAFNEMAAHLKNSVERTRRDEESRKELLAGISLPSIFDRLPCFWWRIFWRQPFWCLETTISCTRHPSAGWVEPPCRSRRCKTTFSSLPTSSSQKLRVLSRNSRSSPSACAIATAFWCATGRCTAITQPPRTSARSIRTGPWQHTAPISSIPRRH